MVFPDKQSAVTLEADGAATTTTTTTTAAQVHKSDPEKKKKKQHERMCEAAVTHGVQQLHRRSLVWKYRRQQSVFRC